MAEYKDNTSISGTGNSLSRKNEIAGDELAAARNFICGYSLDFKEAGCVVKDEGHDFEILNSKTLINKEEHIYSLNSQSNTVNISDGLAFSYGYFGSSETVEFNILPPAVEQYFIIYLEMNKSVIPNTCEVKMKNNYASPRIGNNTFRQDELSTVKTGVYQMPLWLLKVTNKGIQQLQDLRNLKYCIRNVVHSDNGTHVLDNGTIGQNVTIPTLPQGDVGNKAANTEFATTAIRAEINR